MTKKKIGSKKKISTEKLSGMIRKIAREKNLGELDEWTLKSMLKS